MALFSGRNINKAKSLLDKNRHKVGGMVDKATDTVDKVTKGKSSNVTAKIDEAAHKFSGSDVTPPGAADLGDTGETTDDSAQGDDTEA